MSIDELDVPENVRLVTGRRLDRLSEATCRLLLVAAVSGRRSSFQLLQSIGELSGDALLDALENGALPHPRGSVVAGSGGLRGRVASPPQRPGRPLRASHPAARRPAARSAWRNAASAGGRTPSRPWDEAVAVLEALGEVEAAAALSWTIASISPGSIDSLTSSPSPNAGWWPLGQAPSQHRARLLAMTGMAASGSGRLEQACADIAEAKSLAEAEGDRRLLGEVGVIETIFHDVCMQLPEILSAGQRAAAILREEGVVWNLADVLCFVDLGYVFQGRFSESDVVLEEVRPLADRIGHFAVTSLLRRNGFPKSAARVGRIDQLDDLARRRGRGSAVPRGGRPAGDPGDVVRPTPRAPADAPRPLLRQYDGALIERVAGMTADSARLPHRAEEHFETALRQAEELPHVIERPQVRHWYGRFLVDRGGRDDLDRARTLLDEAVDGYRTIGMPRHTEMAQQLLDRAGERC